MSEPNAEAPAPELLARIEALKKMAADLAALREELRTEIAELRASTNERLEALEQHKPVLLNHGERLDGHDGELAELKTSVAENAGAIAAMHEAFGLWRSATLEKFELLDRRIIGIDGKLATIEGGVAQVVSAVNSTRAFYDNRDKKLDQVLSTLQDLVKLQRAAPASELIGPGGKVGP